MAAIQSAVEASTNLFAVANELSDDATCAQFCAILKASLSNVIRYLLGLLPSDRHSKEKAAELIKQLNELRNVQRRSISRYFSRLLVVMLTHFGVAM